MTTAYIIIAALIGALIGAAIRHFAPMHRHTYTGWRYESRLTVRDDFGSSTPYDIWAAECSECGLPKKIRVKI